jgi:hypothetical protein
VPARLAALATLAALAGVLAGCGGDPPGQVRITPESTRAEARANAVAVSPLPGTEDASPTTQISFLGRGRTKVDYVSVVGSRSGQHAGRLEPYSTGTGASYVMFRPFAAGERVAVRALVGSGSGSPRHPVTTVFTVAHQSPVSQSEFPKTAGSPAAVQHFATDPYAKPSTVTIRTPAQPGSAPGYLFLAPYQGYGSAGPMIAEQNGTMVWSHPLPEGVDATNFQVQSFHGKPVLTWWQGRVLRVGFGEGQDLIYDSSYHQVATVRAGNGYHADLHEIRLTPQGTAWIDAFDPIEFDLSRLHGARDGILTDSVVQEIDIKTGLVMWEWHALGHIPLRDSHNPAPSSVYPWDYVHVNSIDEGSSGDVLLSARNTWGIYDVDIRTGAFRWQLGDPHGTLRLGRGTQTHWQHDAEFQPGGLISVFDNGSTPPLEPQSRGLLLRPDFAAHSVSLVKQLVNPTRRLRADAQGNLVSLGDGRWLMGYGNLPDFTEYDASGRVLLDGTLGPGVQDFRTFLAPWSGHPTNPPAIVARRSGTSITVQTSWNGATGVASWELLGGFSPSSLSPLSSSPRHGFETTLRATTSVPYVATRALDAGGATLGDSPAVRPS